MMAMAWLLALVAPLVQEANRLRVARFDLSGPLERVRIELDAERGATHVDLDLAPGERLQLDVPLDDADRAFVPRVVTLEPSGASSEADRAVFAGFRDPAPAEAFWSALPAGQRARVRPAVPRPLGRTRGRDWALLLAGAALVLGGRKRPARSLVAGAVTAGLLLGLRPPVSSEPRFELIDADLDRESWVHTIAAFGRLELADPPAELWVATRPAAADLSWSVERNARAQRWTGTGSGALFAIAPWRGGRAGQLAPSSNEWGDLEAVWTRGADGAWSAHGPWKRGAALGAGSAGNPPGWLAGALPPGRPVLLAREEGGAVWLRVVGE